MGFDCNSVLRCAAWNKDCPLLLASASRSLNSDATRTLDCFEFQRVFSIRSPSSLALNHSNKMSTTPTKRTTRSSSSAMPVTNSSSPVLKRSLPAQSDKRSAKRQRTDKLVSPVLAESSEPISRSSSQMLTVRQFQSKHFKRQQKLKSRFRYQLHLLRRLQSQLLVHATLKLAQSYACLPRQNQKTVCRYSDVKNNALKSYLSSLFLLPNLH